MSPPPHRARPLAHAGRRHARRLTRMATGLAMACSSASLLATGAESPLPPAWRPSWWAWLISMALVATVTALATHRHIAVLGRRNRQLAERLARRDAELQQAIQVIDERGITDPLTGLKNHHFLQDHIEQDLALARRRVGVGDDAHLLFLLVDIDHFRQVNDSFGRAAGDRVLQQLRDILLASTRESDLLVRWSNEVVLVLARFASAKAGPEFAERIRDAVAAHRFDLGDGHSVRRTCSIGFASYPSCGHAAGALEWEQVVNLADECLYAAKRQGRNGWAGLLPMRSLPNGAPIDMLRIALAALPRRGSMPVTASWLGTRELTDAAMARMPATLRHDTGAQAVLPADH